MQISDQSGLNPKQNILISNLANLQSHMSLSDDQFVKHFDVPSYELINSLSVSALEKIASKININLKNLITDNIDYHLVFSESPNLSKYDLKFATSRNLAVKNILNYLKYEYPTHHDTILRHLRLNEKMFDDPTGAVTINLINQIYLLMEKYHFPENSFETIGFSSINEFRKQTQLLSELEDSRSLPNMMELFCANTISIIDKTWSYKIIAMTGNQLTVRATAKRETAEHFKTNLFGSLGICKHRVGVLKAISQIFLNTQVSVTESKCIHRGDPYCDYEIILPQKVRQLSLCPTDPLQ